MKRLLLILTAFLLIGYTIKAQDSQDTTERKPQIRIAAMIDPMADIPYNAQQILKDRMDKAILKNGLGCSDGQRFILTARVNEIGMETTTTTPVMYVCELEVSFFIGDAVDGTLFAQGSITVKGAEESQSKAYTNAIKKIKTNDPVFKKIIKIAKEKIEEYNANDSNSISNDSQNDNQDYDMDKVRNWWGE